MFARERLEEDTIETLGSVAIMIAKGTERKRTEEALREVREAERQRMARELHDSALQDLTYALAETQITQAISQESEVNHRLQSVVEALKRAGRELRSAVYNLRLEEEHNKPFAQLLGSLVESYRKMGPSIDIRLAFGESFPSTPRVEAGPELLRVFQEALTNARRHSGARKVLMSVGGEKHELVAEISDDGQGFDAETARPGVGLASMRERVTALGGKLEIESEPGKGTRVAFRIPLRPDRKTVGT